MPVDLPLGVTVIPLSCEAKSLVDNRKVSLAGGVRIISETPACLNNAFRAGQKNMSFLQEILIKSHLCLLCTGH